MDNHEPPTESGVYNFRFRTGELEDDVAPDDLEAVMALEAVVLEDHDLEGCGSGWAIGDDRRTLHIEGIAMDADAELDERTGRGLLGAIFDRLRKRTGGPIVAATWYTEPASVTAA